jgi:leader peptidase (prepilin peptidase)/N-methyltransferase
MNPVLSTIVASLFGAVIGSFLNVCIYRIPKKKSVVLPPSACAMCGHRLTWIENIPVFSYLLLGGKCRGCGAHISIQYLIVELITAAMFAGLWWVFGPSLAFFSRAVFGCLLIVLFAIDLEHHLLPNVLTLPGIVVGFSLSLFGEPGWQSSLIGIIVGGGVLYLIAEAYYRLRHEEGLGMGDVKMLAMIGAFIGWKLTLVALMMSSLAGSVVGVALIATQRGGMKYALPFGTFLAMGAALADTIGHGVLQWYVGLLQP